MTVKSTVLIERIDGIVQKYHTTEASLLSKGYTTETVYYRDQERLAYIREEFIEEGEEPEGGEPVPENLWEVVVYTSYREKRKGRHDRYEMRTVVRASTGEQAVERGISKFVSVVPDEHSSYLDSLGIYGVDANEAAHRIQDNQEYRGVRYFRNSVGSEKPSTPTYTWDEK